MGSRFAGIPENNMKRQGKIALTVGAVALSGLALLRFLAAPPAIQPEAAPARPAPVAVSPELPLGTEYNEKTAPADPIPDGMTLALPTPGGVAPAPIVSQPLDSSRFPVVIDNIRQRFYRPELDTRVTLVSIDVVTLESAIRASQPFLSLANSDEADIGDPAQPDFAFQIDNDLTLNLKILRAFEYTDFPRSLNASGTVVAERGDIGDWTLTVNSSRDMVSGTIRTDLRIYVFENSATPSVRFVADLDRSGFEGSPAAN